MSTFAFFMGVCLGVLIHSMVNDKVFKKELDKVEE
jgi:hypothetical protein